MIGKYFFRNMQEFEGQELVFLMKVLADEVNVGMTGLRPQQVRTAAVSQLTHLTSGYHLQW